MNSDEGNVMTDVNNSANCMEQFSPA
jgi:hypothetical protein